MASLDVGCGSLQQGDFNIDVQKQLGVDVVADGCHLPFRSNTFQRVVSHHSLEHMDDPLQGLREMVRVSSNRVIVTVPHRYGAYAKIDPTHKHFLHTKWLGQAARHLGVAYNIKPRFRPLISLGMLGLFMRPHELRMELHC